MSTSCPMIGQVNSWRDCRWAICTNSSKQGVGNSFAIFCCFQDAHFWLSEIKTFLPVNGIISSLSAWSEGRCSERWPRCFCQPSGASQPQTVWHQILCLRFFWVTLIVKFRKQTCMRTTDLGLLFSGEDLSFDDVVSRWGHTYSLAFLFSERLYFLSEGVSALCVCVCAGSGVGRISYWTSHLRHFIFLIFGT